MPTPGWLTIDDLPRDARDRIFIDPPSLEQMLDQYHNYRGDVNMGGHSLINVGQVYYGTLGVDAGADGSTLLTVRAGGTQGSNPLTVWENAAGTDLAWVNSDGSIRAPVLLFADGTSMNTAGVPSSRQIIAGSGLTGGGDLSADRTLAVLDDTSVQKHRVSLSGTLVGTRREINFIQGSNVALSIVDNAGANRVDVTITASGGSGGGGSQTPWTSHIDAAGYELRNAGRIGIGTASPEQHLHVLASGVSTNLLIDTANQTTYNAVLTLRRAGAAVWNVGLDTADNSFKIATGGLFDNLRTGPKVTVAASGAVGVNGAAGTSGSTLYVAGHNVFRAGSTYNGLSIERADGIPIINLMGFAPGNDTGGLDLHTGGALKARINSDATIPSFLPGSLGIGTTGPAGALHVRTAAQYAPSVTFDATATAIIQGADAQIAMSMGNANPWPMWIQARHQSSTPWMLWLNPLGGTVTMRLPNAVPPDTDMGNSQITFYVQEGSPNNLWCKFKTTTGAVKTLMLGSIA